MYCVKYTTDEIRNKTKEGTMNITFNKDTYLIMDKSPINFKGVEFNVVKFNENEIAIKLTITKAKQ